MRVRTEAGITLLVLLPFPLLPPARSESSFDERYQLAAATNPAGLQFVLRTSQARFHPGERISLTLEFSSTSPNKYRLNGATYDRSGLLATEEFVLDRDDVVDPLIDYFGSGVLGGIAGGLRTYPVLGLEPHRIELTLNDWFRFDKPGRYRLFLKSHRLSRERTTEETGEGLFSFAAVSNILQVEITEPDPAWEATQLREIETILDEADRQDETPQKPLPGVPPQLLSRLAKLPKSIDDPKVRRAKAGLRYLGTRAAVQLILKRAQENDGDFDSFGLIGATDRAFAISELDRYIQDPTTSVNSWIIRLRTLFDFVARYPKPLYVNLRELQSADWERIRTEAEQRQPEFEKMLSERATALVELPNRKSDKVREDCVNAIAELAPDAARRAQLFPPEDYGMSRAELIKRFETLPEEHQFELLTSNWGLVRGPEMIPVLRRIIERAHPSPVPQTATGFSLWHGPITLGEEALDRLLQLAPNEARRILLEDTSKPAPRFPFFAVDRLPARDVPKADVNLGKALKKDPGGAIPLIAKFGTIVLADAVRASYMQQEWSCGEQEWFLAYFLRVRPKEGRNLLEEASAGEMKCGLLFTTLSRIIWTRDVEELAIASLNHSNAFLANQAAQALATHGGPVAEQALWRRLEQWNEQWRGRANELDAHPITGDNPNGEERRLGNALINAITTGRAWFLDEERRKRLAALCLDERCRKMLAEEEPGEVKVEVANGAPIYGASYRVAQYSLSTMEELKAKLAQFPAGTTFRWCPQAFNPSDSFIPEERQDMFTELLQFLAPRQMRIEEYSKDACGY